jgi:hypothetical protein
MKLTRIIILLLALLTFLTHPQISLAESFSKLAVNQSPMNNEQIMSSVESQEISAQNPTTLDNNSKSARIILKTACQNLAGTNSNIQAQLPKQGGGNTNWVTLDNPGNDRKKCAEDSYTVTFSDPIAGVENLRLRTDSSGASPSWKLAWTEVSIPGTKQKKIWNRWLGANKYKGQWCVYTSNGADNCP